MKFLWIYVHGPSDYAKTGRFYELEYSIRSVKQNYKGKAEIYVVGDDPELDVNHIPVDRVENSKYGFYRHFDQIRKLKAAMEVIKDEFVLMYDDIYIIKPTSAEKLRQIYALSEIEDLSEYSATRKGSPLYRDCWRATYNRILEYRDDLYDWETHLPRHYDVEMLKYIIKTYSLDRGAYLSYSMYAAQFGKPHIVDETVQQSVLEYRPTQVNWDKTFSARYLNTDDNGISGEFVKLMKNKFPKML
jgi:hypothetical protein